MKGLDDTGLRLGREHMLQALLTERFRLALTPSVKQLPIYEIAFASEVPGLHRASVGAQYGMERNGVMALQWDHMWCPTSSSAGTLK
jgi:uncharacterized protein (TIGR03435 family)